MNQYFVVFRPHHTAWFFVDMNAQPAFIEMLPAGLISDEL